MTNEKGLKYFSTFSGIGGFELGIKRSFSGSQRQSTIGDEKRQLGKRITNSGRRLQQATCVGYSEIDKYAAQIYQSHFPTHRNYGDITTIDADALPDFDLYVGGFPCQAFSIAGKRGGFDDTRGTLFFDVARILKAKRPKHFLLENVKGLLSHDDGRTFKTIIATLVELGYSVEWQVLNSKDFGVPQNRERVFIVGHFGGKCEHQVFPLEATDQDNTETRRNATCRAKGIATRHLDRNGGLISNYASTIQVAEVPHVLNDCEIRRLTPTECERLQGFPDGWTEEVSNTQRYKTLGNAVTVNVIEAVITELLL